MSHQLFEVYYETSSGDTENSTQTMLSMNWRRARLTMRRRAPHTIEIEPDASQHLIDDFTAGRLWEIRKDSAYWQVGFMDAASPVRRSDGWGLSLPGWGNAYALMLSNTYPTGVRSTQFGTTDADAVIGAILDDANHGTGGDWFPSGGRTLGSAATSLVRPVFTSIPPLDLIGQMCDIEGWTWRAGINSGGTWTFKASATVEVDLSSSLHWIDGANCQIESVQRDGSKIDDAVQVLCRRQGFRTQTNGSHAPGTSFTVDSTSGMFVDDTVAFEVGSGNYETRTIATVPSATTFTVSSATSVTHGDNTAVESPNPPNYGTSGTIEDAAIGQAHHNRSRIIYNDHLQDKDTRSELCTAIRDTYDHVLATARVRTADTQLIDACLTAGLEAGDTIKLTSNDRQLARLYSGTSVKVQEIVWEFEAGRLAAMSITVGDLELDALAVLERMIAAATAASKF